MLASWKYIKDLMTKIMARRCSNGLPHNNNNSSFHKQAQKKIQEKFGTMQKCYSSRVIISYKYKDF